MTIWSSLYWDGLSDNEVIRESGRQCLPPERVETFNLTSDVGDMGQIGQPIVFANPNEVALVRLLPDANNWDITGLVAPSADFPHRRIMLQNIANQNNRGIRFRNNNGGSAAENRFLFRQNNVVIQQNEMLFLIYDPVDLRWRPISRR